MGPGDIRVAHRTGEFVPVDELERCVDDIEGCDRKAVFVAGRPEGPILNSHAREGVVISQVSV